MAKVKSEYHYKIKNENNGQIEDNYVLLDVSDDEEGYGVVLGDINTDRTIALGQGHLQSVIADMLFTAIVNEIENKKKSFKDETISSHVEMEFDFLQTLYDSETKTIAANDETKNNMIDVMHYISTYYYV